MIVCAWIFITIYSYMRILGNAQDINVQCPEKFKDNELNLVSCEIDSTAFSCGFSIMNIYIQRPHMSSAVPVCNPDPAYPCTAAAPNPTQHEQCACTKLDGNKFTYTLAYRANYTADLGATFTCQVCPGSPSTYSTCVSIKFKDGCDSNPCEYGGACGATSPTAFNCACIWSRTGRNCAALSDGAIALIVIMILILVALIIAALIVYCLCKPGKPRNLEIAGVTVNSVKLTWKSPEKGREPFTYCVQYCNAGEEKWFADQPKTNGDNVTNLRVKTEYKFRVLAKNCFGSGPFTDIIKGTTSSQ